MGLLTSLTNGKRILCKEVKSCSSAMEYTLAAVTFRSRDEADAKRDELRANGHNAEVVKWTRFYVLAIN